MRGFEPFVMIAGCEGASFPEAIPVGLELGLIALALLSWKVPHVG